MAAEGKVSHKNLYLSVFIINIVYFAAGTSVVWTSSAIPRLRESKLQLNQKDESWLVSCFAIGQVFGPLLCGCFMDTLGRKPTMFLIIIFQLISWPLLALPTTINLLYLGRIVGGLTFSMSVTVLPVYVAEIADAKTRGTLNSFPLASRSLGYFAVYGFGPFVGYVDLVLICLVAPVIALALFFNMPESPYHLVSKDLKEKAFDTIEWLRRGATKEAIQTEADVIQKSVEEMMATKKGFADLFSSRASIRALYLSCGLLFFLQMSGVPLIMSITESLFQASKVKLSSSTCTIIFGGVMLFVGLMGPSITKRFGYKIPLVLSALGMALSLAVFGTHFYLIDLGHDMSSLSAIPVTSLVAYISFYSLGFSNSAFAVVGELFPPSIKALGTSMSNCIGFACALLSIQLYYFIKNLCGTHFGIWSFAISNALAVVFVLLCVPNTNGMSLAEIQELLNKPWFSRKNKIVPEEKYTRKEVF